MRRSNSALKSVIIISAILFLLIFSSTNAVPLSAQTGQGSNPDFEASTSAAQSRSFSIPATSGDDSKGLTWFNTGLSLTGEPVTVTATGEASYGPSLRSTPNGPPSGSADAGKQPGKCPECPLPGAPVGALIAKVGKQKSVLVGSGPTLLTGSGKLYFAFNDGYGNHNDNSGGYSVTITSGDQTSGAASASSSSAASPAASAAASSAASAAAQAASAAAQQPTKKFKVTFVGVEPYRCHDIDCENDPGDRSDCAKWDMIGSVNGKMTTLMGSACVPGSGKSAFNDANKIFQGETIPVLFQNVPQGLGPYSINVAIPANGAFVIEASGRERDSTSDGAPNSYVKIVEEGNSQIRSYLEDKYNVTGPEVELGYALDIAEYLKKTDNTVAKVAGQTGQTAAELSAIFGAQSVPGWGQLALAAYSFFKFGDFLADLNPDDGIGIIKEACSSKNNYCLGEHLLVSQFNGKDQDSEGDYDLLVRVEEI